MKIFRTTGYRGDRPWFRRYCTSRRQFAQLKQDLHYYSKMTLESADIPDEAWQTEQSLEDEY